MNEDLKKWCDELGIVEDEESVTDEDDVEGVYEYVR